MLTKYPPGATAHESAFLYARSRALHRLLDLGKLPVVCTVLTGLVALYIFLVAFGNITDPDTNQAFVRHVLAMDTTFQDEDLMWRAITSKTLQDVGYVGIIVWESLTAVVLLWATAAWVLALRTGLFDRPRRLSTVGFLMFEILFLGGFITIGGSRSRCGSRRPGMGSIRRSAMP